MSALLPTPGFIRATNANEGPDMDNLWGVGWGIRNVDSTVLVRGQFPTGRRPISELIAAQHLVSILSAKASMQMLDLITVVHQHNLDVISAAGIRPDEVRGTAPGFPAHLVKMALGATALKLGTQERMQQLALEKLELEVANLRAISDRNEKVRRRGR